MIVLYRSLALLLVALGLVLLWTGCTQDDASIYQPPRLTIASYNVEDMDFEAAPKELSGADFTNKLMAKLPVEDVDLLKTCYLFSATSKTWNLKAGLPNDRVARVIETLKAAGYPIVDTGYLRIAKYAKDLNVDVLSLQEVQSGTEVGGLYSDGTLASSGDEYIFSHTLKTNGYYLPYRAFSNNGGSRLDYVAFFSKYPLTHVGNIWPERMVDPATGKWYKGYRPALKVKMRYRGNDVWMFTMHLKSNSGGGDDDNFGLRRAQAHHLATWMLQNLRPEKDLIVITGDMNTLTNDIHRGILGPTLGTIDYMCIRHDNLNASDTNNDLIPANLVLLGGATNEKFPGVPPTGITYPSSDGISDVTFDYIILSREAWKRYVPGSLYIYPKGSRTGLKDGASDHYPVQLSLEFD